MVENFEKTKKKPTKRSECPNFKYSTKPCDTLGNSRERRKMFYLRKKSMI